MSLATELIKNSNTGWWVRKNNSFTLFCINEQVFGDKALQSINETAFFHNAVRTVFHTWRNLEMESLRLTFSPFFGVEVVFVVTMYCQCRRTH